MFLALIHYIEKNYDERLCEYCGGRERETEAFRVVAVVGREDTEQILEDERCGRDDATGEK